MKEINRSLKTTFVFSTHDKKVIAKADRLVRIEDGRIRRLGDADGRRLGAREGSAACRACRAGTHEEARKVTDCTFLSRCAHRHWSSCRADPWSAAWMPSTRLRLVAVSVAPRRPRPIAVQGRAVRHRRGAGGRVRRQIERVRSKVSAPTPSADPTHWSRARRPPRSSTRRAQFAENVKWKIERPRRRRSRLRDVEFLSRAGQARPALRLRSGARTTSTSRRGSWDFRVGAQQIIWGEVVGLFFADVVSARDMREFLLPGFDIIRIPQWAARAEYFAGDTHVEFIWIPVPLFDRIGKPGADFYPAPLPSPTPAASPRCFCDPAAARPQPRQLELRHARQHA